MITSTSEPRPVLFSPLNPPGVAGAVPLVPCAACGADVALTAGAVLYGYRHDSHDMRFAIVHGGACEAHMSGYRPVAAVVPTS